MVQASDGTWYAYFADKTMATNADRLSIAVWTDLDFGKGCNCFSSSCSSIGTGAFTDTEGVYLNTNGARG